MEVHLAAGRNVESSRVIEQQDMSVVVFPLPAGFSPAFSKCPAPAVIYNRN
jgi:hypothetical protein